MNGTIFKKAMEQAATEESFRLQNIPVEVFDTALKIMRTGKLKARNPQLAAQMAKAGLTGKDLAVRIGINSTTISRIMHYRQIPTPYTAASIAAALDCTVEELRFEG